MKHLLLTILLILTSCSKHQDHETTDDYPTVDEIAAGYIEQMKGLDDETLFPDRCDRLTFLAFASATVKRFDLSAYEYTAGELHRDVKPCLDDLDGNGKPDSKSEISYDPVLGVLHHAKTWGDQGLLLRIRSYGRDNGYVMGKGDRRLTYMPQLEIIISDMLGERPILTSEDERDSTHKEHILALSLWLKLRYDGLTHAEFLALKAIKQTWIRKALINRMTDGDQADVIEYLRTFPDSLPLDTGIEGWGGCPRWLYFFLLKAIIDGK